MKEKNIVDDIDNISDTVVNTVRLFQESLINLNDNLNLLEENIILQDEEFNVIDFFNCKEEY